MPVHHKISISLMVLYFASRQAFCSISQVVFPNITTDSDYAKNLNSDTETAILNKNKARFFVKCSAPYPVKWSFHGFMSKGKSLESAKSNTKITSNGKTIYEVGLLASFIAPTIIKVTCAHFNNGSIAASINILVENSFDRVLTHHNNMTIEGKQRLIPCLITTDRTGAIELLKQNGHEFWKWEYVSYDPTLGFILNEPEAGNFKCRSSSNEVNVLIKDPYEHLPYARYMTWLNDEIVSIKCNSFGEIGTLAIRHSLIAEKIFNVTTKSLKIYNNTIKGSIFNCTNSQGVLRSTLHYTIVDTPKVRWNHDNSRMECVSKAENLSIACVSCRNTHSCEIRKVCFHDVDCQKRGYIYFPGKSEATCLSENSMENCVAITNIPSSGLIECGVKNKARTEIFEFFTGLRPIKYLNWSDAPTRHLVHMEEIDSVVYANESTTFFCEAVEFLFSNTFHYNITYSNGTELNLLENVDFINVDRQVLKSRRVPGINIVSGIRIFIPVDAIRLTCNVFLMTEPIKLSFSRNFTAKYLRIPKIERKETAVKLTKGIKGQLICKSNGIPDPEIKWERKIRNFSEKANYYTKLTNHGEVILQFKNPAEISDQGEYICTSVNRLGNDTVTFTVTVAEPEEANPYLYYIIYGTLAVILLLAIFVLYFWRQRNLALNLLRELTDEEIEEFINGNSDLWLLNIANQQENINYMPYNNEYEIPIRKIDFGQSSLLGSGAFGMVVTAKLDDATVAVKSTKPTADVLYFKSLLAELKIMMFVSHHENIVKFIGANTENIKNRKIYVVLELCALGSLEAYLRESTHGEAKEIVPNENTKRLLSTDLLLLWCYHIASAMDYLSVKKIVHADLATRNVLLNENHIAKLADFGLSVQLYKDKNYATKQQTMLPYRWMSIESLKQLKFSTESDIWSYGVTIWEIFSFGQVPYSQESWSNDFVNRLEGGMRLQKSKYCPENVYNYAMTCCWEMSPSRRPTFSHLANFFMKEINNENYTVLTDFENTL